MTPDSRADNVLVTYASKMGGTKEIAAAIGAELSDLGIEVTLLDAASVYSVDRFDAVVLGSSLYIRRWRPDAITVLRLLAKRDTELGSIPVWLFQSGPCGNSARTEQVASPRKVRRYADRLDIPRLQRVKPVVAMFGESGCGRDRVKSSFGPFPARW